MHTSIVKLDELYVVGGPSETLVLIRRTDTNNPVGAGRRGAMDGYPVTLHVFARVRNGRITEWYDAPLNKVSPAGLRGGVALTEQPSQSEQPAQPPTPPKVPAACMSYREGSAR